MSQTVTLTDTELRFIASDVAEQIAESERQAERIRFKRLLNDLPVSEEELIAALVRSTRTRILHKLEEAAGYPLFSSEEARDALELGEVNAPEWAQLWHGHLVVAEEAS